jgi:hypothetical protein
MSFWDDRPVFNGYEPCYGAVVVIERHDGTSETIHYKKDRRPSKDLNLKFGTGCLVGNLMGQVAHFSRYEGDPSDPKFFHKVDYYINCVELSVLT